MASEAQAASSNGPGSMPVLDRGSLEWLLGCMGTEQELANAQLVCREWAEVAQSEDRGPVGDHGNGVALDRVAVRGRGQEDQHGGVEDAAS